MPTKFVPVKSFEQALAADAAGVLYVANFSNKELEARENREQEWMPTTQPWLQDTYMSDGRMPLWKFRFPRPGSAESGYNWPMEDFAVLVEYDDDDEE